MDWLSSRKAMVLRVRLEYILQDSLEVEPTKRSKFTTKLIRLRRQMNIIIRHGLDSTDQLFFLSITFLTVDIVKSCRYLKKSTEKSIHGSIKPSMNKLQARSQSKSHEHSNENSMY